MIEPRLPGTVYLRPLIDAGAKIDSGVSGDVHVFLPPPAPWISMWLDRAHVAMALWAPEEETR